MVVLLLFQIFILRVKLFQIITQSSIPDFCTDEVLHSMDCQTAAGDDSRSSYPASSSSCFWIISQHCCQLTPEIERKIFQKKLHDNVSVRERGQRRVQCIECNLIRIDQNVEYCDQVLTLFVFTTFQLLTNSYLVRLSDIFIFSDYRQQMKQIRILTI